MRPRNLLFTAVFVGNAALNAAGLTMTDFLIPLWVIGVLWGGWFTAAGYEIVRWHKRRGLPRELADNPGAVVVQGGGFSQTVEGDQHIHFDLGQVYVPKSVPFVIAGASASSGSAAASAGATKRPAEES